MHAPLKLALWALPFTTTLATKFTGSDVHVRDDTVARSLDVVGAVTSLIPSSIDSQSLLDSTLNAIRQQNFEIQVLEETFAGLLGAVVAAEVPDNIPDAIARIAQLVNGTGSTIENAAELILNGLSVADLTQNVLAGYLSGINSYNNNNPPPPTNIYPKKSPQDAPYTLPESQLRAAIYIPPGFTYGTKRPVLFVPGTGAFGGVNFISNLGKLLTNDGRFDPVYLNVPGAMLDDAQVNSEYIAYAINYLGSITGTSANANNLAVIPWSQGNLDTQWVLQYWPSTRPVVTDFISASADFHGTTLAYLLDPALINPPLPPSIIQQEYDSNFVLTLRYGGGGSPYVNSTSVHSITDEIVQPQYSPFASADYFTLDLPGTPNTASMCPALKNVPYTNNQIQTICAGQPGGSPYTHEGVLYSPLMYALTIDALTHDGPGRVERLDLATVCSQFVAPGLSLADVLATEGLIPLALVNILLYPNKVTNEPPIMQYALQANAQCSTTANTTNATTTSASTTPITSTRSTTTRVSTTTTDKSTTSFHRTGFSTTTKTGSYTTHSSSSTSTWTWTSTSQTTSWATTSTWSGKQFPSGPSGLSWTTTSTSSTTSETTTPVSSSTTTWTTPTTSVTWTRPSISTRSWTMTIPSAITSTYSVPTQGALSTTSEQTTTVTLTSTKTVTADCGCDATAEATSTVTTSSLAASSTNAAAWSGWSG